MNRKIISLLTLALLLSTLSIANSATTLMTIGRSPFYKPPLTTPQSLIDMVQEKQADVKMGFKKAGRLDLFDAFITQLPSANIETVEFQKGSFFEWMLFKKKGNGVVRLAKDVTWANTKPFTGLKFDIEDAGNSYTFAVPLGCGNIALMGVTPIPPPPAPVVSAPVNQPPQCGMSVSSVRAFCGEIITVDASGSSDPDGDISSMTVAFLDDQGQIVSEKVVDGSGLQAEVVMPCGASTLKVSVMDNSGAVVTSPECTVAVTGQKKFNFLADLGYYKQFDPAHHVFGRVGMEYKFNENFGVLALIGVAPHVDGIDGETAFLADILGEYSFSRYFIDLGIGGWITDGDDDLDAEDTQLDLIAAFGARVYGEPESFNASLFLEVRSGVDEVSDIIDYGRFGLGVRFRF